MLYDFEVNPDLVRDHYQVCICGSGAAGLTIASQLSAAGVDVVVFEGGGENFSSASQELYEATTSGYWPKYKISSGTRLRFLGGTTNHWAGRCKTFSRSDFERPQKSGLPGWPLAYDDFMSYLDVAMETLDLEGEERKESVLTSDSLSFHSDQRRQSAPTRFGLKFRSMIDTTENLHVFLHANLVKINRGAGNDIATIQIKDFQGVEKKVSADVFVIALGAIENARMLLVADDLDGVGIGNSNDMVGRCFMEHFNVEMGSFIPNPDYWKDERNLSLYTKNSFLEKEGVGGSNVSLSLLGEAGYKHGGRLGWLREFVQEISCSNGWDEQLQFLFSHHCEGEGIISTLTEHLPNLESRVTLNTERDSLGVRKCNLHTKMGIEDEQTIRKIAIKLAKEIALENIGRVRLPSYILNEGERIESWPHAHHMGTTRMADDPKFGVVDSDCKVFETDNLFVSGSSVFPLGGGNNPTLPIVQLSHRLSSHLLEIL